MVQAAVGGDGVEGAARGLPYGAIRAPSTDEAHDVALGEDAQLAVGVADHHRVPAAFAHVMGGVGEAVVTLQDEGVLAQDGAHVPQQDEELHALVLHHVGLGDDAAGMPALVHHQVMAHPILLEAQGGLAHGGAQVKGFHRRAHGLTDGLVEGGGVGEIHPQGVPLGPDADHPRPVHHQDGAAPGGAHHACSLGQGGVRRAGQNVGLDDALDGQIVGHGPILSFRHRGGKGPPWCRKGDAVIPLPGQPEPRACAGGVSPRRPAALRCSPRRTGSASGSGNRTASAPRRRSPARP